MNTLFFESTLRRWRFNLHRFDRIPQRLQYPTRVGIHPGQPIITHLHPIRRLLECRRSEYALQHNIIIRRCAANPIQVVNASLANTGGAAEPFCMVL
ncbi:hypothetical protein [Azospira oryzae]|uniref:hypothetical protein n=1 Tax=Azospira oryzae TaxID=146939 RepID=UPI00102C7DA2|nr:hypothetical protein [Azospira oryzae]